MSNISEEGGVKLLRNIVPYSFIIRNSLDDCDLVVIFPALTRGKNAVKTLTAVSRRGDGFRTRRKGTKKRQKNEDRKCSKDFRLAERVR